MEVGGSYGKTEGRITGPEGDRNSTRRPTEATNLDAQSFKHQSKNIYGLDLGLPAHM